jgi:hypothetical protein
VLIQFRHKASYFEFGTSIPKTINLESPARKFPSGRLLDGVSNVYLAIIIKTFVGGGIATFLNCFTDIDSISTSLLKKFS